VATIIAKNPFGENIDYDDGVTDGADVIIGSNSMDHIEAGGGDDVIKGGGGADFIYGGEGRDTASYEDSTSGVEVNLKEGRGYGGSATGDHLDSIEDLFGSMFDDKLIGNGKANTLNGQDGNDTLKGGGGADTLIGGNGNDIIEIDGTDDAVDGGDGIDTLVAKSNKGLEINLNNGHVSENTNGYGITYGYYGQNSPYWDGVGHQKPSVPLHYGEDPEVTNVENVFGTAFNDDIYGNDLANWLVGGGGNDVLAGGAGDDKLEGGNGNDIIVAGIGADTLTGGANADTFWFWSLDDSKIAGGKPQDVIADFQQGQDKIDLSHLSLGPNDLLVLDNQNVGGVNYSYVGIDSNHDNVLNEGEFAIAVKVAAGTVLTFDDFII
jgi:Ca2+-binding RTX toxin-like protein